MSGRRGAVVAVAAVAGSAAAVALRDPLRRARLARTARVWRLSARRGADWTAHRVRRAGASDERKAELDTRFVIRSAEDAARELGQMKGAMMKIGQLLGFILEGLPEDAQRALATLQADAPPMAPGLAASVVRRELGQEPERLFRRWTAEPAAAASVGQVHRAVLRDGRSVAVKVQYPGVDTAIQADLDNAEVLYGLFSAFALKGLDVHALVDELRERMGDELDYRIEAAHQSEFARSYRGHPFITVPAVVDELSTQRVLTTEWVDGVAWADFLATADPAQRQRAGEVLFRFAQGSIHRLGVFNGDPHPGNYRFLPDGRVAFLDFGLVKRWTPGEWERLSPCLDAILADDRDRLVAAMEAVSFLAARPRPRPPGRLRLRQHALPALPDRAVPVHPRVRGGHRAARRRRPRALRRGRGQAQPAGQLRHPRPRGLGRVGAARQARGGGPLAGHPGRVPGGRPAVHAARRGGRRVVGRPRRGLRLTARRPRLERPPCRSTRSWRRRPHSVRRDRP